MPLRFSANLSTLYPEIPFLDRFARAAHAGFSAVEFHFPYAAGIQNVKNRLDEHGLRVSLFNLPPGEVRRGEWGLLSDPAQRDRFKLDFAMALEAAVILKCPRLNTMYGQRLPAISPEEQSDCACENLLWAAPQAEEAGVTLLIEALNPKDFPNCGLPSISTALRLLNRTGRPSVKLLYDVYHAQMTEGNLLETLKAHLAAIGHVQIADVPGRHQPGTGEIDFPAIFSCLEGLHYAGYVGLEYNPTGDTDASLSWLEKDRRA